MDDVLMRVAFENMCCVHTCPICFSMPYVIWYGRSILRWLHSAGHSGHASSSATWQGLAAESVVNEREGRTPRRPPPQPSIAAHQKPAHRVSTSDQQAAL